MLNQDNSSIGILLQDAGFISPEDLQTALKLQAENDQIKLTEILVIQQKIKTQTVDFFTDTWQRLKQEGRQFPIGYYFRQACLLNSDQSQVILTEQQTSQQKFGAIAVQKGWLSQNTVNFFLNNLLLKSPELISLNALEKYDQQTTHLEQKHLNSSLILSRILGWTGGNSPLTKAICHTFANSDFNISVGLEVSSVDKFVERNLSKNWQTAPEGAYLRAISDNLVNNQRCDSALLLKEYQKILLSGSGKYIATPEQDELLLLGLVTKSENALQVTSILYQQIFHQDWVATQLAKLSLDKKIKARDADKPLVNKKVENPITVAESQLSARPQQVLEKNNSNGNNSNGKNSNGKLSYSQDLALDYPQANTQPSALSNTNDSSSDNATKNTGDSSNFNAPEPMTRLGSLIALLGIAAIIPMIWIVNNYYSKLQQPETVAKPPAAEPVQQPEIAVQSPTVESDRELQQFCNDIDLVDQSLSINLLAQLERKKRQLGQNSASAAATFPENCEYVLNRLRVLAAPILGKQGRVIEAEKNLCKVPADSDSIDEARIWLNHWSNHSESWKDHSRDFLSLVSECPARDSK